MLNSTLALFTRSLRLDSRSVQAHLLRVFVVIVILFSLMAAHSMSNSFGAPGLNFFTQITWLNFMFVTLAGIAFFPSAISEEKEEESLGLLKMAGISPAALLLGKSSTRLASMLLVLAVELPFILLSITLGGVTLLQVLATMLALAAYLVFLANLGLFCSVFCSTSKQASSMMTVLLAGMLIVVPMFDSIWRSAGFGGNGDLAVRAMDALLGGFQAMSVTNRLVVILGTGFSQNAFSVQVVCHLAAAGLLFGLSWMTFERFTQETHGPKTLEELVTRPFRRTRRTASNRTWHSALAWKDFYFVAGGKTFAVFRLFLYLCIIGALSSLAYISVNHEPLRVSSGRIAMISMLIAGAIEIGLFASRIFREEVKGQTLPLLMMLPISTPELIWAKRAALGPAIIPPLSFFVLGAICYPEGFADGLSSFIEHSSAWYGLIVFLVTLQLAAYLSLLIKWGALPLAVFLIYLVHMVAILGISLVFMNMGGNGPTSELAAFFVPIVLGIVIIFAFEQAIRTRLEELAGR